jgi:hypothetical protein
MWGEVVVDRRSSGWTRAWGIAAVALCAVAPGACATYPATQSSAKFVKHTKLITRASIPRAQIPLPDRTLLQRQAEPDCTFRGTVSSPMTAEEIQQKLDYEQQCYRQSEMNVRGRLHALQDAVEETIEALERQQSRTARHAD